jgi:diguanylate cyclase (GGDEF)-like protein
MLAAMKDSSTARRLRALLASLCLISSAAWAQASLESRMTELRELARYVPDKALVQLKKVEAEARAGSMVAQSEFLSARSSAYLNSGNKKKALEAAEELIALGIKQNDKATQAKGILLKAYAVSAMNDLKQAHQLAWEAERIANSTHDLYVRVIATISSGQSYEEEGNLPMALTKLQHAIALARQLNEPLPMVMALNALANTYDTTKEYDKGFELLLEAQAIAEVLNSPGRIAALKTTEYVLAVSTKQYDRAQRALTDALAVERRIGAHSSAATTLVNLSDLNLRRHNWNKALSYGLEALREGIKTDELDLQAIARINIGQAYLAMGKLAEGKRSFEAGMEVFVKSGDKPELQAVLSEYGSALERAGDMAGAVKAYHRERELSNELFEKQRQKAMWELQEKYEAEKKQRQIELLSRENQVKTTEIDNRRLQQRVWWLLAVVFAMAAVIVGMLYRKVRQANAQLEVKNLELKAQSALDPLTSLYNRRHFQEFMRTHNHVEKRGSGTSGEEVVGALFLLDVDHFKHVNDTYGHAAGDAVLRMISDNLREILRETDMIVRWGGEEFLAFLPAIPRSGLDEIARRILTGISAHTIDYQDTKISVNVSIGFAPFPLTLNGNALPWERAVNLVDMALYLAKAHGRNRAYGVRGFANVDQTDLESLEQDLERAWRAGMVDLSVVLGGWPDPARVPARDDAEEAGAAADAHPHATPAVARQG